MKVNSYQGIPPLLYSLIQSSYLLGECRATWKVSGLVKWPHAPIFHAQTFYILGTKVGWWWWLCYNTCCNHGVSCSSHQVILWFFVVQTFVSFMLYCIHIILLIITTDTHKPLVWLIYSRIYLCFFLGIHFFSFCTVMLVASLSIIVVVFFFNILCA